MRRSLCLLVVLGLLVLGYPIGRGLVEVVFPSRATLVSRYAYLLVTVEGPPDWADRHHPSIVWDGAEVRLPVVFRYHMTGTAGPRLGATTETCQALDVLGVEVPVRVTPAVACRVSNEPAIGFIPEQSPRHGEVAFSIVRWVTVGPPDRPAGRPDDDSDQILAPGPEVVRQVEELLAAGKVIDVGPAR